MLIGNAIAGLLSCDLHVYAVGFTNVDEELVDGVWIEPDFIAGPEPIFGGESNGITDTFTIDRIT
jgi:hypothetical protein